VIEKFVVTCSQRTGGTPCWGCDAAECCGHLRVRINTHKWLVTALSPVKKEREREREREKERERRAPSTFVAALQIAHSTDVDPGGNMSVTLQPEHL
jgi:hypothetical protein